MQQQPGALLGRKRNAFVIDKGDAVAVAIERDAQLRPLTTHGLA